MSIGLRDLLESAVTVTSSTCVEEAVARMNEQRTDRVYLVSSDEPGVRVVTDFALLKAILRGEACCTPVSSLAAPVNEFLTPEQPLELAAVFFRSGFRTEMVVLEQGRLMGVVRRTTLLSALVSQGLTTLDRPLPHSDEHQEMARSRSATDPLSAFRKIG